jgi:hypothetical protein
MYKAAAEIQRRLRESDIPSVLIGGLAVALWGEPRLTRDIDLKVALGRDDTDRLLGALRSEWEPLAADPAHALEQFGVLFLLTPGGVRFDLLLAQNPFDDAAIERGRVVVIEPGVEIVTCTPEDLIIYKLVSTRPLDHEDARRVAVRQGDALDDEYVVDWLAQFEQAVDDSTLIATYRGLRAQPHA